MKAYRKFAESVLLCSGYVWEQANIKGTLKVNVYTKVNNS